MKIFVTGATGAIGRPLIVGLIKSGHEVIGMTRSQTGANFLFQQGAKAEIIDIFDADAVRSTLMRLQPEVIIDQLTSLPRKYTPEAMAANAGLDERTRRQGGANLQAAAQAAGVHRYIMQSSAFWYAPGEGLADEETPFAFNSSPAIAAGTRMYTDLEHRVMANPNLEAIVLRYGFFYGERTWYATNDNIADQVRQQQFSIIGDGQGVWSWVHIEDAANATVAAVNHGLPGIYNIVDDYPSQMRVWLSAYAHWLGAKAPLQVSVEEALRTQGEDAVYYATKLRGASNIQAKQKLGFQPRPLQWLFASPVLSSL